MPIYLPPISRRGFLRRTFTAAAGLALGPNLFAAEKPVDDSFWALFSDPHIAADRNQVHNRVNMADHLQSVVAEVTSLPVRPAGVFVNGDCAYNSGQKEDYATVAGLLKPLRSGQVPIHLTLGNHDNRQRFWEALKSERKAKRPLADRQTLFLPTPRANWFVLDSLEETLATPGMLGQEQLDWLARTLDANADKPALVMLHHNPGLSENVPGLKDTFALFEVIRPRKQVKAYIFGHTHVWDVTKDDTGIYLVNLPPIAYVFKEGNPSGWVRATLAQDGMKLEMRCLDTTHKAHGEVKELKWRV
jgi:3',5'-cyclic AMP phosphodiesterase CpdA